MNAYRGGPPGGDAGRPFNRYVTEARRRARRQRVGSVILLCALGVLVLGLPLWTGGIQGFVDHWHPRLLVLASLVPLVLIVHLIMRWRNSRPDAFMMKLERETNAFLGIEAVAAPRGVEEPRVRVTDAAASSHAAEAAEDGAPLQSEDLSPESREAEARRALG